MADKMEAVQGNACISSVYISFLVLQHIAFRRMPASALGFLVDFRKIRSVPAKWTDKQTHRNGQTNRHTQQRTDKQTHTETDRQTDTHRNGQTS